MTRRVRTAVLTALSLGIACAHSGGGRAPALPPACRAGPCAPPLGPTARPEVTWPEPPATPRVRLSVVLPDPASPAMKPAWWRRAWNAVTGIRPSESDADAFVRPFGVAAGQPDVVIADPDAPAVNRVRADGTLAPISCAGRSWVAPMALAFADDGALWVADAGAGEIVRRGADGGCIALGSGTLERPTGIAVGDGRVFVADPPRHEIVVFSPATGEVSRFGGRGDDDGHLSFPSSVALAADGTLLVVDSLNFRIARFSPDGAWLGSFGTPGESGGELARPKAVATGPDGRIYVTDAQRDLVLVFLTDGTFEYAFGASGPAPGSFVHPAGVSVAGGRVFVADSHNRRVQGFEILGGRP